MIKFVISAVMRNGDKWETVPNSRSGMEMVVMDIPDDNDACSYVCKIISNSKEFCIMVKVGQKILLKGKSLLVKTPSPNMDPQDCKTCW